MDSLDHEDLKSAATQAWLHLVYGGLDTREWALAMRIIRQALEEVPDNIKYKPTSLF